VKIPLDEWLDWQLVSERCLEHRRWYSRREEVRMNPEGGRRYVGVVEVPLTELQEWNQEFIAVVPAENQEAPK
jgi:hypothetical protein